mmetsp:Transcript_70234/g.131332  ORF Transcript_70234/g.131332 Transcript_70234/m.131332 type:complete len:126 (-) Transcript_70234:254-631(-)
MRRLRDCLGAVGYSRLDESWHATLTLHKLNGDELTVECSSSEVIADVKRKVSCQYDLPEKQLTLVLGGRCLEDYHTLSACGLTGQADQELNLVVMPAALYIEVALVCFRLWCAAHFALLSRQDYM